MLNFLNGKKTYMLLAAGAVVIVANHFGVVIPGVTLDPNNWVSDLFTMAAGTTMRKAIG